MKTAEELNVLKEEVETLNKKLHELTEEELAQVSGGLAPDISNKSSLKPVVGATAGITLSVSERPA